MQNSPNTDRELLKPDKRWTPKSYIFVTFGEPCPSCRKQPFTIKILSKLLSLFHKDQVVSTLMQDVVCPRTIFSLIWQDSISPLSVSKTRKGYKMKYFPPIQLKMFHLVIKAWSLPGLKELIWHAMFVDKRQIELSSKGRSSVSQWIWADFRPAARTCVSQYNPMTVRRLKHWKCYKIMNSHSCVVLSLYRTEIGQHIIVL